MSSKVAGTPAPGAALSAVRASHFRKTRNGSVIKLVSESYAKQDFGFGFLRGKMLTEDEFQKLVNSLPDGKVIVPDTNILLGQIDALESSIEVFSSVFICQTALEELRNLSLSVFRRVMALMLSESRQFVFFPNRFMQSTNCLRKREESPNDFHDRCIVQLCLHLQTLVSDSDNEVLLLTNDAGNQDRAQAAGIKAIDAQSFVRLHAADHPEVMEIVAAPPSLIPRTTEAQYTPYLDKAALQDGLRSGKYVQGALQSRTSRWDSCYVIAKTAAGRRGVVIEGARQVNRALVGDMVVVELLPRTATKTERSLEEREAVLVEEAAEADYREVEGADRDAAELQGRVVGILRRNLRHYYGSVDSSTAIDAGEEGALVQVVSVDQKVPRIWIRARNLTALLQQRLVISVDQWPVTSQWPLGHLVSVLGPLGDREVETHILLKELGIAQEEFSTAVLACLPPTDWCIDETERSVRKDFRHLPVVSVDPPGCKDIDDALHCIKLPNGHWQVGVHIADVTHFVKPGSALDKEAAARSTSTYLVERRLDMLPGLLTTQLCSLRCDEEHLAFSVLWEMDDDAQIISVDFGKSVIYSRASLTYDQAQSMLALKAEDAAAQTEVAQSVRGLARLARLLKQRRIAAGALTLSSPEVRFKLDDESRSPTDLSLYVTKEANSMVEEWMLLANITVSKKILKHFPTLSVLRRHLPPSREQFLPLLRSARVAGVTLDITTSKTLADSLDQAVRADNPMFNRLLRMLATRCMMPAQYFCSGEVAKDTWHHYGLATPVYTHFTSPIRRYADVLVHRLLAAALGLEPLPALYADRSALQDLCVHMNRKHRAAQHAQRASVNVYSLLFFRDRPAVEDAYIVSVDLDAVDVLVPKFGLEAPIAHTDFQKLFGASSFTVDAEASRVVFQYSSGAPDRVLQVLDGVKVRIEVQDSSYALGKLLVKCC